MLENHKRLAEFVKSNNLYNIIKSPTCFKSVENPTAIDHIFVNRKYSFIESHAIETGLSDFLKMVFTCMKSTFVKLPAKKLTYRDYANFDETNFLSDFVRSLNDIPTKNFQNLASVTERVLEKHAPRKAKLMRGNNKAHMNKALRKEIMHRSKLRNIANKTKNPIDYENYKKQRNKCVFLNKKSKKDAMKNIDVKGIQNAKNILENL